MLTTNFPATPAEGTGDVWILDTARTPLGPAGGALREVQAAALLAGLVRSLAGDDARDSDWLLDTLIVGCASSGSVMPEALPFALARAGVTAAASVSLLEGGAEAGAEAVRQAVARVRCGESQLALAGGIHLPSRPQEQRRASPDLLGALAAQVVSPRVAADVAIALHGVAPGDVAADVQRMRCASVQDESVQPVLDLNGLAVLVADDAQDTGAAASPAEEPWRSHHALALKALPQLGNIPRVHGPEIDPPALVGASLMLLGGSQAATALGLRPLARIVACSGAGHRPLHAMNAVALAFGQALERAGWSLEQIEWLEVCSRFAGVPHAVCRVLRVDAARLNTDPATWRYAHAGAVSSSMALARLARDLERLGRQRAALVCCGDAGGCVVVLMDRGNS